ncbi:hypothetical protein ALON55S_04890 [Alishewanella longhuensis]
MLQNNPLLAQLKQQMRESLPTKEGVGACHGTKKLWFSRNKAIKKVSLLRHRK